MVAFLAVSRARRFAKTTCFTMLSSALAVRERLLKERGEEPEPGELCKLTLHLRPYWGADAADNITYAGQSVESILPELLPAELLDGDIQYRTQIQRDTTVGDVTVTVVCVEVALRFSAPQDKARCLRAAIGASADWFQSKGLVLKG